MAYTTTAAVRTRLTGILSDRGKLDSSITDDRINDAILEAKHLIWTKLRFRGYTTDQIGNWEQLEVTHKDLSAILVLQDLNIRLNEDKQADYLQMLWDRLNQRLENQLPLDTNGDAIDDAIHDDNFLPLVEYNVGDDKEEHGREFGRYSDIAW